MKLIDVHYLPEFRVKFTKADVKELTRCSKAHYDHKCKALSQPGGIIYGLHNFPEWTLKWREIDLLCKVLEASPDVKLSFKLQNILRTNESIYTLQTLQNISKANKLSRPS